MGFGERDVLKRLKIETRGRAEQDERHGPDGRDDRDAVLGGTTAIV